MSIGNQIRNKRLEAELTQQELANALEIGRTTVAHWESGKTSPRNRMLDRIAQVLHTTPAELMKDELGISDVDALRGVTSGAPATVPLITQGMVHAGEFDDQNQASVKVDVPASVLENHPAAQALLVTGDCMNRVIPDGYICVLDPHMDPHNGSIVAVETEDHEAILRRWYRFQHVLVLQADSYLEYDDITITGDENPIRVIGVVIWSQKDLENA